MKPRTNGKTLTYNAMTLTGCKNIKRHRQSEVPLFVCSLLSSKCLMWFYSQQRKSLQTSPPHLGPLGYLPLRPAGRALAGSSLHRPLQVSHGAQVAVDRAVQARRQHLPAADLSELEALAAGPGALAPAARLPPETQGISLMDY